MRLRALFILAGIVSCVSSGFIAARQAVAFEKPDAAVEELDRVSRRMTAYLKAIPTFRVETKTQWKLDGVRTQEGNARSILQVRHPDTFRLEVLPNSPEEPLFVCASDGQSLTRYYHRGAIDICSRSPGGLGQLLNDALTDNSLKGSGLDIVVRPDAHQYLLASVSGVKYFGKEELGARSAHHFSAAWVGGSRMEFWIAADREPCLLRFVRTHTVDIAGEKHDLQMESNLSWTLDVDFSDKSAEIQLPDNVVEVKDLQSYLLRGGTAALLGNPAPALRLKTLEANDWSLNAHRGKQNVVLYFFASWAAPSTEQKTALLDLVKKYHDRDVVLQAINVGEKPDAVRTFMESRKYTHSVALDLEQNAAAAYRVTSLPAIVLVAKDGTIQATHVGLTSEVRRLISTDLEQLTAGKTLVPASDRTDELGKKK